MEEQIAWDPPAPDIPESDVRSIWLVPTESLSFKALTGLKRIFRMESGNLVQLKNRLCDGQAHVLEARVWIEIVPELEQQLVELGVAYDIRPGIKSD